jgi:hypothetical protein
VTHRTEGRDFTVQQGSWAERLGLTPSGIVLVRPDGHILAIAPAVNPGALDQVSSALSAYLAKALQGAG